MKFFVILFFGMSCAVASAQDAEPIPPASLDVEIENTKLVAVPEPSISLLVATGGFFYLMRWRGGRRR